MSLLKRFIVILLALTIFNASSISFDLDNGSSTVYQISNCLDDSHETLDLDDWIRVSFEYQLLLQIKSSSSFTQMMTDLPRLLALYSYTERAPPLPR